MGRSHLDSVCVGLALHARTSQAAAGEVEFGDVIIELANGGWQSEASVFLQRDIAAPGLHPDQLEGQLTCGPENHSIGFCLCRLGATRAAPHTNLAAYSCTSREKRGCLTVPAPREWSLRVRNCHFV